MMRSLLLILLVCVPVATSFSTQKHKHKQENETTEAQRSTVDAHSFMELFTKLERDWAVAIQHKDKPALDNLVAPEFILRTSDDPEYPIIRNDWMQDALNNWEIRSFSDRSMVIRAFAANAIVSFIQTQQATIDGKDSSGNYFVIDLWVVNNGTWQVAARYIAPVSNQLAVRGSH